MLNNRPGLHLFYYSLTEKQKKSESLQELVSSFVPEHILPYLSEQRLLTFKGERRRLSILFADISGFTSLSEQLDPEQVIGLVNQFFLRVIEISRSKLGVVDKFLGDAALIIFGASRYTGLESVLAIKTALELVRMVESEKFTILNSSEPIKIGIKVGINTGRVVAGIVGGKHKREYTVIGDEVNLASRIEDLAQTGEILVSHQTMLEAKDHFEFEDLGYKKLKGKSEPLRIYKVLGSKKIGKVIEKKRQLFRFVDREKEIASFEELLRSDNKSIRSVAVTGDTGIGKTELIGKLRDKLQQVNYQIFEAGGQGWWGETVLAPVRAVFRQLLKTQEVPLDRLKEYLDEALAAIADKTWHKQADREVSKELINDPNIEDLLFFLCSHTDNYSLIEHLGSSRLRENILALLSLVASAKSHEAPISFIFDDLEGYDSLSVEVISDLVASRAIEGAIIILGYERSYFKADLLNNRCDLVLVLKPLEPGMLRAAASMFVKKHPQVSPIMNRIIQASGGIPLVFKEMLNALAQQPAESLEKASTSLLGDLQGSQALEQVALSRFDALSVLQKDIIRFASILDAPFSIDLIARFFPFDKELVHDEIKLLADRGFFTTSQSPSGQVVYKLARPFFADAIYQTILKDQRREMHQKIADTLESLSYHDPNRSNRSLALHFHHAGIDHKAYYYLLDLAESLSSVDAHREAIEYLELAGMHLPGSPSDKANERARLNLKLGSSYEALGMWDKAQNIYLETVAIFRDAKDINEITAKAYASLGSILINKGEWKAAQSYLDKANSYYIEKEDLEGMFNTYNQRGILEIQQGNLEAGFGFFNKALECGQRLKDPRLQSSALVNLGIAYNISGKRKDAIAAYLKSLPLFEFMGDFNAIARTYHNLGMTYRDLKRFKDAENYYRKALEILRRCMDYHLSGMTYMNLSDALGEQGDTRAALSFNERAEQFLMRVGDELALADCRRIKGKILHKAGKNSLSLQAYQEAAEMAQKGGASLTLAEVYFEMGQVFLMEKRRDKAIGHLNKAREIFLQLGNSEMVAAIDKLLKPRE